ncbi:MAG: hypothetical protein OEZ58_09600 [Gammaproteobacteria bacterium]|nr:hypothetical protein [Gammaproteobacteria bacterium]
MNKDKILTVRCNNLMTLGLGLPALVFVAVVFFSTVLTDKIGFFGIVAIGILYCLIIEQHSAMLLAWQIKKTGNYSPAKRSLLNSIVVVIYNFVWWIPIALPLLELTDYRLGAMIFFVVTLTRAFINFYRMNRLTLEQAIHFPFRGP